MHPEYEKLKNCLVRIRQVTDFVPQAAIVLGSGLGNYADRLEVEAEIPYADLPGFPVSTVPGHAGKFIFGRLDGIPVVCMKGRVHYYEGYPITDVVMPARLMGMMGAKILILTNASGGIRDDLDAGDLMMITDHISDFVPSPLIGPNIDELGTRFPDMSTVYCPELQEVLRKAAGKCSVPLREGVYIQFSGPNFETPAEIRMARTLGADAVGMSTVVEAIAANHMGMKICGISCVCNKAAGISPTPLTHDEVQAAAAKAAADFAKLITAAVLQMREDGLLEEGR